MKVLRKEPGKAPEMVEIPNELEDLQAAVGGYIETCTRAVFVDTVKKVRSMLGEHLGHVTEIRKIVIICNEEGRLRNLRKNCTLEGPTFVGTIIVAGVDGEEFADFPLTEEEARKKWPHLWEDPYR